MQANRPWELADEKLLTECRFEAYRASGPGGQKRNKTSSAVRITHLPTGVHATAPDSRSQRDNRIHALRRLRHKLAIEIRHKIDPLTYHPPGWFTEYAGLHINAKNPMYPSALAETLDVIKAMQWSLPRAAVMLSVTSSALTRFLRDDPAAWTHVNASRTRLGLKPLRHD